MVEGFVQFTIIHTQIYQSGAFLLYQVFYLGIVVTFVLSTYDKHGLRGHALQGIPGSVYVRGLGIVDEAYASHCGHVFQAVRHSLEVGQCLADALFLDACDVGRDTCSQRIVEVVRTTQGQLLLFHIELDGLLDHHLTLICIGHCSIALEGREREELGFQSVFLQFPLDDGVIIPEDEGIFLSLVLDDAHLGVYVVLHAVVVAVQMIGCDVHQDGNVCTEVVHIVQLERTQLYDVVVVLLRCHLQCKAVTNIASQSNVQTCTLEDMIDQ